MSYFKSLKEKIEKMAQVPARSRGSKTSPEKTVPTKSNVPSKGSTPSNVAPSNKTVNVGVADKNVADMQTAMQELARAVIRDSTSATMGLKTKDVITEQAEDPIKKSKKAFNDFVAEQYIGTLDDKLKGVEWSVGDHTTSHSQKKNTQTDVYELDAVMNTLNRIGSENGEFIVDGNWGFRTNNALRNILGFAYALLQLEGDFGLSNNIYTAANWEQFKKILSDYKVDGQKVLLSPEQKSTKAVEIIKHLKSITKLYDQFRRQVTARPEFRPFIEGQRTFDKYPGTPAALSPEEIAASKSDTNKISGINYVAPALSSRKLDFIPLKALTNKSEYLKWMVDYAGLDEASAIKIFNNVIKPKIEAL